MTDAEAAAVLAALAGEPAPWAQPGKDVRWWSDNEIGRVTWRNHNYIKVKWPRIRELRVYNLDRVPALMEPVL